VADVDCQLTDLDGRTTVMGVFPVGSTGRVELEDAHEERVTVS
jgi:hypothetical protein